MFRGEPAWTKEWLAGHAKVLGQEVAGVFWKQETRVVDWREVVSDGGMNGGPWCVEPAQPCCRLCSYLREEKDRFFGASHAVLKYFM